MGDGKATVRIGAPPRVAARRSTRFTTRASSRSLQGVRAPIVIDFGATVMRVGYADQSQPQHCIPALSTLDLTKTHNKTEAQWYSLLSPCIDQVYDRLMCHPTTRRVVVLHQQYVVPTTWKAALEQVFWNMGVPAVTFVGALEILPVAQGWKRGLIFHFSRDEASCICHADGHVLPYTYQSIPECGYQHLLRDSSKLQQEWSPEMDFLLLDELHNPNSFVVAALKCLEACPRDIRCDVVGNVVCCGDGALIIPDMARRVAKRLEQILEGSQPELERGDGSEHASMAVVPVSTKQLQPLASRLQLVSCTPYRPDVISWVSASLWAATWNKYQDDETRIDWKFAPHD